MRHRAAKSAGDGTPLRTWSASSGLWDSVSPGINATYPEVAHSVALHIGGRQFATDQGRVRAPLLVSTGPEGRTQLVPLVDDGTTFSGEALFVFDASGTCVALESWGGGLGGAPIGFAGLFRGSTMGDAHPTWTLLTQLAPQQELGHLTFAQADVCAGEVRDCGVVPIAGATGMRFLVWWSDEHSSTLRLIDDCMNEVGRLILERSLLTLYSVAQLSTKSRLESQLAGIPRENWFQKDSRPDVQVIAIQVSADGKLTETRLAIEKPLDPMGMGEDMVLDWWYQAEESSDVWCLFTSFFGSYLAIATVAAPTSREGTARRSNRSLCVREWHSLGSSLRFEARKSSTIQLSSRYVAVAARHSHPYYRRLSDVPSAITLLRLDLTEKRLGSAAIVRVVAFE